MDIRQRNGESPIEHHRRLVYGKLVDKTLSDVDYTELAEEIYGQPYSSDVARRMMYGSRKTLELIDSAKETGYDSETISEIELQRAELKKERQRFFDQRREYNKLLSTDGRKEHLYDSLMAAAANLNNSVGTLYIDRMPNYESLNYDTEGLLVFSDWHFGMTTDNVFNKYSTEVCKKRVINVVERAYERVRLHKCGRLHIVILGDLFHGAIHVGARVASEELVCDQLMQSSEILAQSILWLSDNLPGVDIDVYMTYGNHARVIADKSESIHRDNLERIIPWWLEQRLKGRNEISVHSPGENEYIFIDVCGHGICASHGDLDSVKTSPRLIYTLFQKKYHKDIECILLGDKHHRESFEELGVVSMICGSLCGTDDYANTKRLFSEPSQLLLIINRDDGVDAEYRIKCD